MCSSDLFPSHDTSIPYPETDKRDDTEGVKPKQMKRILDVLDNLDLVKALFKCLKEQDFRRAPFFEDGYISYKDTMLKIDSYKVDYSISKPIIPQNVKTLPIYKDISYTVYSLETQKKSFTFPLRINI